MIVEWDVLDDAIALHRCIASAPVFTPVPKCEVASVPAVATEITTTCCAHGCTSATHSNGFCYKHTNQQFLDQHISVPGTALPAEEQQSSTLADVSIVHTPTWSSKRRASTEAAHAATCTTPTPTSTSNSTCIATPPDAAEHPLSQHMHVETGVCTSPSAVDSVPLT
jgi:hypothetical protein